VTSETFQTFLTNLLQHFGKLDELSLYHRGYQTFPKQCTPPACRQMNMHRFSISPDKHVPLQHFGR